MDFDLGEEDQIPTLPLLRVDKNANESPHVVILGAGASLASFPRGDRHRTLLPIMANFVNIVGLRPLFDEFGIDPARGNIEEIYDALAMNPNRKADRERLETAIFDYFARMEIPDHFTLYDELLLTLRAKDIVATFNWDPLIVQAYRRNSHLGQLPRIVSFTATSPSVIATSTGSKATTTSGVAYAESRSLDLHCFTRSETRTTNPTP